MIAGYVAVTLLLFFTGVSLLLRKGRTLVDGCQIWVVQDTHCTALVNYRDGRKEIRFGAEVAFPKEREKFLYIDLPHKMYTNDGHEIPNEESDLIKERLSRGLKQLGISYKFSSVESGTSNSPLQ